jgi:hypothetical protein
MVSLTKLLRIRQGIGTKYKNTGLEKFRLSILRLNFGSKFSDFLDIWDFFEIRLATLGVYTRFDVFFCQILCLKYEFKFYIKFTPFLVRQNWLKKFFLGAKFHWSIGHRS